MAYLVPSDAVPFVIFFEMIAQDQFVDSLKSFFKNVLNKLATSHARLQFLPNISNEIFYGLKYIWDKRCLEEYDGSCSEVLFLLTRVRVLPQVGTKKKKC